MAPHRRGVPRRLPHRDHGEDQDLPPTRRRGARAPVELDRLRRQRGGRRRRRQRWGKLLTMQANQWPLTAAATQLLLALPPSGVKGRQAPPGGEAFKLGLKELLQRGAFRLDVTPAAEAWRGNYVTLYPAGPVQLPDSLAALDGWLRPFTPDLIDGVIRSARRWNPQLVNQVREWFTWELTQRGLVERYEHKSLGLFSQQVMRRTQSGDAWAATAYQYQQRLQTL